MVTSPPTPELSATRASISKHQEALIAALDREEEKEALGFRALADTLSSPRPLRGPGGGAGGGVEEAEAEAEAEELMVGAPVAALDDVFREGPAHPDDLLGSPKERVKRKGGEEEEEVSVRACVRAHVRVHVLEGVQHL